MSGSFADSLNHAEEGSGKRRREQENDQFSTALALSVIWSGSLGFNSEPVRLRNSHLCYHLSRGGSGQCEFSGVISRGRPGITPAAACLALTFHSTPGTWMLSVKIDHYLLSHRSGQGQRHVGGDLGSCLALLPWLWAGRCTNSPAPSTPAIWVWI